MSLCVSVQPVADRSLVKGQRLPAGPAAVRLSALDQLRYLCWSHDAAGREKLTANQSRAGPTDSGDSELFTCSLLNASSSLRSSEVMCSSLVCLSQQQLQTTMDIRATPQRPLLMMILYE